MALPAAYAFSRYRFLGDKHLFFWLLTNRMAPPAVFALPFFQLYSAVGLFDTPYRRGPGALPVQRAAGGVDPRRLHVAACPKEIDETAFVDGYSFPRFFVKIFMPLSPRASASPPSSASCSPGWNCCWPEPDPVDAKPIAAAMTRTASASGYDWGCWRRPGC